MLVELRNFADA